MKGVEYAPVKYNAMYGRFYSTLWHLPERLRPGHGMLVRLELWGAGFRKKDGAIRAFLQRTYFAVILPLAQAFKSLFRHDMLHASIT
jgi:hypothetical protein